MNQNLCKIALFKSCNPSNLESNEDAYVRLTSSAFPDEREKDMKPFQRKPTLLDRLDSIVADQEALRIDNDSARKEVGEPEASRKRRQATQLLHSLVPDTSSFSGRAFNCYDKERAMNTLVKTVSLEEILTNVVVMHWNDFGASSDTLLHIEYHRLPSNKGVEFFKIWSSTAYGVWDLVCQYWMSGDRVGRHTGITFHPPFYSANLGQMFTAIMQHQKCFADRAIQTRDGMIQISAPSAEESWAAKSSVQQAFVDFDIHSPETASAE